MLDCCIVENNFFFLSVQLLFIRVPIKQRPSIWIQYTHHKYKLLFSYYIEYYYKYRIAYCINTYRIGTPIQQNNITSDRPHSFKFNRIFCKRDEKRGHSLNPNYFHGFWLYFYQTVATLFVSLSFTIPDI